MKTLSLEFDTTGLTLSPRSPDKVMPTSIALSQRVMLTATREYSEQHGGLDKAERKLFCELDKALEAAVKENLKEIELSDEVFGFVRKIFRETKLPADRSIGLVEQNIDAVNMK